MKTLHLRNVRDDVVERLERLAAASSTSVNVVAGREPAEVSRRAENPVLRRSLPDREVLPVVALDVVEALDWPPLTADGRLARHPGGRCPVTAGPS